MNNSHYPTLELCKKIDDIEFPSTELWIISEHKAQVWKIFSIDECFEVTNYEWRFEYCPSVMEMLDIIPNTIVCNDREYYLTLDKIWWWYETIEWTYDVIWLQDDSSLPDNIANLILWLVENKYLVLNK